MRKHTLLIIGFLGLCPLYASADSASLRYLNMVLGWNAQAADKSVERLSTGRILLTDDPASYAIDQTLEKYIRGLDRIILNQTDMISYYRVMDSSLGSMTEILQRIHELVLQRADGILSDDDQEMIDLEIRQQYDEVLSILSNAEFNTKKLFGDLWDSPEIKERLGAPLYLQAGNVEALMRYFIRERAVVGSLMERLESETKGEAIARENMYAAQSRQDIDFASEISRFKQEQLLMMANILMLKTAPR